MTDSVKVNMNFQTSYCHAIDKSSPVVLTLSTASCLSQSETELLLLPAAGPRTVFPFPMMSNLPDHCRYSDRNFKIICFYFAIISKKLQHLTFHNVHKVVTYLRKNNENWKVNVKCKEKMVVFYS